MENKLEFGKRYTWKEVVEAYPGKWVRMSQCELGEFGELLNGILVSVHSDDEYEDVKIEMIDNKSTDKLDRTTCDMNIGVITCLNARMEVEVEDEC